MKESFITCIKNNGVDNCQVSGMTDHFQVLFRQIFIKIAEISEQEKQFKVLHSQLT